MIKIGQEIINQCNQLNSIEIFICFHVNVMCVYDV